VKVWRRGRSRSVAVSCIRHRGSVQGDVPDLSFPLARLTCASQQEKVLDRLHSLCAFPDYEDTRHGKSCVYSTNCLPSQCAHVVGQDDATLSRRPLQDRGICRLVQANILKTDYVQVGHSSQEAAENIAVKVDVGSKAKHVPASVPVRSPSGVIQAGLFRLGALARSSSLPGAAPEVP